MPYAVRLIVGIMLMLALLAVTACAGSGQSNDGVAQIDTSQAASPPIKSAGPSLLQPDVKPRSASEVKADTVT